MRVFENFCTRSCIVWCGGIGIGGGVMLNVLRILVWVFLGIFALNILLSGIQSGNWLPLPALKTFAIQLAEILFFHLGVLYCMLKMGKAIRKGTFARERYTRVLLPSFIFILMADVFFILISVFQGGIFRGWLSKK